MDKFSTKNFWYDRITDLTEFYNTGVKTNHGDAWTISPYHVLWLVPQSAIDANPNVHINQNVSYSGAGSNMSPLEELPTD